MSAAIAAITKPDADWMFAWWRGNEIGKKPPFEEVVWVFAFLAFEWSLILTEHVPTNFVLEAEL